MPIQSIPRSGGAAGAGSLIGGGIGDVISEGLQGLAHAKMQDIQRKRDADEIRGAFPELPHEAVNFLASQPAKERMQYLQQYSSGLQQLQQQQEQMSQQQGLQALQEHEQMQQRQQVPYSPDFKGKKQLQYGGKQQAEATANIDKIKEAAQQLKKQNPKEPITLAKALSAANVQKSAGPTGIISDVVTPESNKETADLYKEINDRASSADKSEKRLKRFEELIQKGDLAHPLVGSFVKTLQHGIPLLGVSLDLTGLMSQDSQEFEKLSTDFLKEAKGLFGSRMTEGELMQFLKTIPSLSQSNEGKVAVIQNMKEFNAAAKLSKKAMNDIIREKGGRPPNLQELIDDKIAPQLDKIVDDIRSRIPKEIPSTQSLPESIFKAIPKALF